jgi:DNA modification methylase
VAFALQADGWWLRQDIIWHKPNPVPESVKDRCTKSHEYIFLLSKNAHYYYDYFSILEPASYDGRIDTKFKGSNKYNSETLSRMGGERWPNKLEIGRTETKMQGTGYGGDGKGLHALHSGYFDNNGKQRFYIAEGGIPARNSRSVWTISTAPYKGEHFATFPITLAEKCILAGTSAIGKCPHCGAPWIRKVKPSEEYSKYLGNDWYDKKNHKEEVLEKGRSMSKKNAAGITQDYITIGWQPSCNCDAGEPIPCIVLDPFSGTATTGAAAIKHRRDYVGIELNSKYNLLAKQRLSNVQIEIL